VAWVPDSGELKWSWADGVMKVTIPELKIHGVLVWE